MDQANNIEIDEQCFHKGHDFQPSVAYRVAELIQENNRNNTDNAIRESKKYMNDNEGIVGFSFNNRTNKPWFHRTIEDARIYREGNIVYPLMWEWYDLYRRQ